MADTLYAFTMIDHGMPDGSVVHYDCGDVIDPKIFSKDEMIALVQNGAVSRFNRIEVEQPEITVEDVEAMVEESTSDAKPTKGTPQP